MFGQYGVQCAQVLVTDEDFSSVQRRENVRKTLDQLMSVGIVPILNENDVISSRSTPLVDNQNRIFWDNDSLAGLIATETNSDLLIILSDIDGLFRKDPTKFPGQTPIPTVVVDDVETIDVEFGEKSRVGRGGMEAKLSAVYKTVRAGVPFVAIANGYQPHSITRVIGGEISGTLFTNKTIVSKVLGGNFAEWNEREKANVKQHTEDEKGLRNLALKARNSSRLIRNYSARQRAILLESLAQIIQENIEKILENNQNDLDLFDKQVEDQQDKQILKQRLKLTDEKLISVVKGLITLSDRLKNGNDPLSEIITKMELTEGLELIQTRSPIGVLLVIFEARPEVLPQVVGLSIASGNSVILKGGKEATKSNQFLFHLIQKGLENGFQSINQLNYNSDNDNNDNSNNSNENKGAKKNNNYYETPSIDLKLIKGLVGMITTREEVSSILKIGEEENLIDIVIPRGSNQLVQSIKAATKISVLGHADGICHIFVHHLCDLEKAKRIIVDSKTNYPSACNSVECLLVQRDLFLDGRTDQIIDVLLKNSVEIFTGPRANAFLNNRFHLASSLSKEYSDLKVTIEMVDDVHQAIEFINRYGSGHTDAIVTEDFNTANLFQNIVDSACVFWNCSTRFSDGYRFGLGAEVGISTNRIHARGPVGLEGLTITKWKLNSKVKDGHCVNDFNSSNPTPLIYTHKPLAKL